MNEKENLHRRGTPIISAWDILGGIVDTTDTKPFTSKSTVAVFNERKRQISDDTETNPATESACCTDVSAFKYIGGSDVGKLRRIFWFLVTVGAMCGLVYQVILCTYKLAERGTNTKVEYVQQNELDFPSVTICNTNMFKFSSLAEFYGGWYEAIKIGVKNVRQMFPEPGISNNRADIRMQEYPGGLSLREFIERSTHSVEDMIRFCQFNGRECSFENFTTTITNYGVCFTFNSAENEHKISTKSPGKSLGLSLILDADESEVVAAPRETVGFKILVHPRGEYPNLQDYGIELQPGTHTPIRLDVTQMSSYAPYGKCGSRDLNYTDAFFDDSYTENKCYLECFTDYIVEKCGCRNFYMPGSADFCSPNKLQCYYHNKVVFTENKSTECSCPTQCTKTWFNPTMSHMTFPSAGVAMNFYLLGDLDVIQQAFMEAVTDKSASELNYYAISMISTMHLAISLTQASNGSLFGDIYPMTTLLSSQCLNNNIFANILFELFAKFIQNVLQEVLQDGEEYVNGVNFTEEFNNHLDEYSDTVRQCIEESFIESGEYTDYNTSDEFQSFLDTIDCYSYANDTFFEIYVSIYEDIHELVIRHGNDIIQTQDLLDVATDFMRKNLVHVDVFFGDLQVETIVEQPSYEFFQFVCDFGGALGLFFGASLLSFIESADVWFSARFGAKRDKK